MSLALVVGGCAPAASTTPSTSRPAAPPASSEPVESPATVDYDEFLYASTYRPEAGRPGGTVTIAHLAGGTQLNPYLAFNFTDFAVMAGTMPSLLTVSSEGRWRPHLSDGPITYADNVEEDATGEGFSVSVRIRPDLK
jgi:hypothetical protein